MSSFAEFKKAQKQTGTVEDLQKKLESVSGEKVNYKDDRFWYPERDKGTGKGSAVIRFLPIKSDDIITENGKDYAPPGTLPWVKTYSHSWQNKKNGKWYIEECPTTLNGEKCPMCDANSVLWNTGDESKKNFARDRKRRLQYISNIYIVSDPATPENEGKVFLFKYGKKIHDKIDKKINPEFPDQKPIDVFNLWEGANFALRIGVKDGYTNYDDSEFLDVSPLGDDALLEDVYTSLYKLSEFILPSRFKSYADLAASLDRAMGNATATVSAAKTPGEPTPQWEDTGDYSPTSSEDDGETATTSSGNSQSDFFKGLAQGIDD